MPLSSQSGETPDPPGMLVGLRLLGGTGSLTPDMKHDSLINILRQHFAAAIGEVAGSPVATADAMVRAAGDPKFGDYQCNVAMSLARPLKAKPRDVAERIVTAVQPALADIAESLEIAGPGFINIRLKDAFLAQYLGEIPGSGPDAQSEPEAQARANRTDSEALPRSRFGLGSDRLGLPPVENAQKVVIDYSSPNTAKQMHVGHVRSMVIGDVFARVLGFEGHEVVRQNHIGDWGTQFGMLIEHYRQHALPTPETHADVLQAIESDYKAAQQRFKDDEAFRTAARLAVGRLQSGDPEARRVWQELCQLSRQAFVRVYERMNVLLDDGDVCGESFYNDRLGPVVAELRELLKPGRQSAGGTARGRGCPVHLPERRAGPAAVQEARWRAAADDHPEIRRGVSVRHNRPGGVALPDQGARRQSRDLRHRRAPEVAF